MNEAGVINNRVHIKQVQDFRNMVFGTISPTDIDYFIDFNNELFIWGELKHGDSTTPKGQRLALERICDASERAGIQSYVLISSHNCSDDILVADTIVKEYRTRGKWQKPVNQITVMEAITKIKSEAKKRPAIKKCEICRIYDAIIIYSGKSVCDICYLAERGWQWAGEKMKEQNK